MTNTVHYQVIYDDLYETDPAQPIVLPDTYDDNLELLQNVKNMYRYLLRSSRRRDRLTTLANAFYIGQALEYRTHNQTERNLCGQILSTHYRSACIHLFQIYEPFGIDHVYRSRQAKLWTFRKLKKPDIDQLIQDATVLSIS